MEPAERIEWHYHTGSQLIYPRHGVLQVFTEAGWWIVPPLRAVWLPAGVAHSHRAHGQTEFLSLGFATSAGPFDDNEPAVIAVSPLVRELILTLTADAPLPARSNELLKRALLDQLRRVTSLPVRLPQPRDDRLQRIADQLLADPSDGRTLAELGRQVGASERTLSRLFRAETGMSFPQWRAQLRLHHAQVLLAHGESVTSTAHACGYHSTSAFIEAFRSAYGTTPGRAVRDADTGGGQRAATP